MLAYKATIRMVGRKQTESWITDGCSMYEKRLRSAGWDIDTVYHKTDTALIQGVETDAAKKTPIVLLDIDEGKSYRSEQLTQRFYEWIEEGGSRICFVIGGGESGTCWRSKGSPTKTEHLSLSLYQKPRDYQQL